MINRQEVMDFSREFGLTANIIEKDYVLCWLLAGIANHKELGSAWVFKGGTCLKKCYFETYRFSEDLDFTITNPNHINHDFLINAFGEIGDWMYERVGIEISKDVMRFDVYQNPRGALSAQGRISYRGPMQPHGILPRIKLDLTADEILVLDSVKREIHYPYSDKLKDGIYIQCYCFEELFAEKIRALGERLRPRDLYDVVHLYRHDDIKPDRDCVLSALRKKCEFKDIPIPTMEILEKKPEFEELKNEWENMLAHQLPILPSFEQLWQELPSVFEWLYHAIEKAVPASVPLMGIAVDETWLPPSMAQVWNISVPLEIIRFAAANRLCVDLEYQNSRRLIEPYSLRKTRAGNILLYAVKHETGELRSYRIERIQGATVTKKPFVPRYAIELTTSNPISAPPTSRRSDISKKRIKRSPYRLSRGKKSHSGPTYVIECPFCSRKFNRKTNNPRLKPHKDKNGYSCSGRSGLIVDVKY